MTDKTMVNIKSVLIIGLAVFFCGVLYSSALLADDGDQPQHELDSRQVLLESEAAKHQSAQAHLRRQHENLARAHVKQQAKVQHAHQRVMADRQQTHQQARMLLAQNEQQHAQVRADAAQAREQAEQSREQAHQGREQARAEYEQAREELRAAASRVAELSADLTPARGYAFRFLTDANRAMLGVSISSDDKQTGVRINSVSPGGPADQAGLQSKDVLLAINDVRLDDAQLDNPAGKVLEVMSELEPGDEVTLEYQRDGVINDASLVAERRAPLNFAPIAPLAPLADHAPPAPAAPNVFFKNFGGRLGGGYAAGLELVSLNADLGRYFGTSEGLLVISVPEDFPADVRSGDVLLSIDGREPGDPHHAFRILRSYEVSETVTLDVLRDRDELEITFEVPESAHPFGGLSMLKEHALFKALEGMELGGALKIKGLEGFDELNLDGLQSLRLLKALPDHLSDALGKDFDGLMEEGFINGFHFEFNTGDDDSVSPGGEFEWVEAEQEDDSII